MSNYRTQLEAEKNEIMRMLESRETQGRARLTSRLREIVTSLNELNDGDNWTQDPGDTKARIVLNNIQSIQKVIRS